MCPFFFIHIIIFSDGYSLMLLYGEFFILCTFCSCIHETILCEINSFSLTLLFVIYDTYPITLFFFQMFPHLIFFSCVKSISVSVHFVRMIEERILFEI